MSLSHIFMEYIFSCKENQPHLLNVCTQLMDIFREATPLWSPLLKIFHVTVVLTIQYGTCILVLVSMLVVMVAVFHRSYVTYFKANECWTEKSIHAVHRRVPPSKVISTCLEVRSKENATTMMQSLFMVVKSTLTCVTMVMMIMPLDTLLEYLNMCNSTTWRVNEHV